MKLVGLGMLLCGVAAVVVWRLLSLSANGAVHEATPTRPRLVAHDSSGYGNDGINEGHPVMGLPGHQGTAYSFDDRGSWVDVPSTADLDPGRRDFKYIAWVNFSATPHRLHRTYDIIRKGLSFTPTGEYKLEIIHGGVVRCTTKDLAGNKARISSWGHPVTDGRWHKIGCARTAGTWSVVVDGWSRSKSAQLGAIANSMPLSIGSKYGQQDMPRGRVDDVKVRVGGKTVGRWKLDERPVVAGSPAVPARGKSPAPG